MPIRPYLPSNHAFHPEDIVVLSTAFEEILCALRLVDRNDPAVLIVAKRVIELALDGERDPNRLRKQVLHSLSK